MGTVEGSLVELRMSVKGFQPKDPPTRPCHVSHLGPSKAAHTAPVRPPSSPALLLGLSQPGRGFGPLQGALATSM
jgi:hypothetical protein